MPGGRPSKAEPWLTEDGIRMINHWKRNGLSDAEIAKKVGVKPSTFSEWKTKYPKITEALKNGLEMSIARAEEALEDKFKPYTVKETQIETWEENGKVVRTHKKVIEKPVLPDTTAIIFFLKSKAGWRDSYEIELPIDDALNKFIGRIDEQARRFEQETDRVLE